MYKPLSVTIIVLYAAFCHWAVAAEDTGTEQSWYDYEWGRGITFPDANLNIGGYFQTSFERPEHAGVQKVALDDFSLFITWTPHARLRFFAEIEEHNWLNNIDGVNAFDKKFNIERLFVEFLVTESTNLRFGKYLTPFGRWNVIHSAPLVWTTSRPLLTDDKSFAPRANGLQLNHTQIINEHNLDISLYLDDSTDLEPKSFNNITFHKAAGLRVNYELSESLQIGASYLAYQDLADLSDQGLPLHQLGGLDFLWKYQGYELMMESMYHVNDAAQPLDEKSLYLQGVVPLYGKLSAVARYEYFNSNRIASFLRPNTTSNIGVAGLVWRPFLPLVFKGEYRFQDNNGFVAPSGLYVSVAMFF